MSRPTLIRFGVFEADLISGELRKQGVRIKLQEQPFQALVALVERRGEVVTREELQKRLWPSDTNVDFDRGLNRAIARVRDALGDDAENPRFIEPCRREAIDSWLMWQNRCYCPPQALKQNRPAFLR